MPTLNELAARVHAWSKPKWWTDINTGLPMERNPYELLMLVVTELAEAMEGERKDLMDDKIPLRKMAEVEMADAFIRLLDFSAGFNISLPEIEGLEEEHGKCPIDAGANRGEALLGCCFGVLAIANNGPEFRPAAVVAAIIVIQAYCKNYCYDLMGAFEDKMKYNLTREDHTHEARRKEGGKKF